VQFHGNAIGTFAIHPKLPLVVSGDHDGKVCYSNYLTGEVGGIYG